MAVAEDTVALVAPKNTMLLDGVRLKLDPVIVTDVLMEPLFGVNDEIDGPDLEGFLRMFPLGLQFFPD